MELANNAEDFYFSKLQKKQVKNILEKLLEFFSREKIKVVLPDS